MAIEFLVVFDWMLKKFLFAAECLIAKYNPCAVSNYS